MNYFRYALFGFLALSGCANTQLSSRVNGVRDPLVIPETANRDDERRLPEIDTSELTMQQATAYAVAMAEAFRTAGNNSVTAQDFLTVTVVGIVAASVIGAADEVSAGTLTRRATGGAAASFFQNRGLSQADIDSIYLGALQTNCIARTAGANQVGNASAEKAWLTIYYVKEIELRVRYALVDEAVQFEDVLTIFRSAVDSLDSEDTEAKRIDAAIQTYEGALQQCLTIALPARPAADDDGA